MTRITIKKLFALICTAALLLSVTSALAKTVEPERTELPEQLVSASYHATVKPYDEAQQCFPVVFFELDHYSEEDVASLQVGDTLVVSDAEHTISEIGSDEYGILELKFTDGGDILMDAQQDGSFVAKLAEDDRVCMHLIGERNLKAAADMVLIDYSDLDAEDGLTYEGLDAVLAAQAQREADDLGLDAAVTSISLNDAGEIAQITIFYMP